MHAVDALSSYVAELNGTGGSASYPETIVVGPGSASGSLETVCGYS